MTVEEEAGTAGVGAAMVAAEEAGTVRAVVSTDLTSRIRGDAPQGSRIHGELAAGGSVPGRGEEWREDHDVTRKGVAGQRCGEEAVVVGVRGSGRS
jgi:hypothetical protein